ncbi:MAG: hypothetical protein Q9174_003403, partial [Haloplaca sp. 1 TL-2023]
MATLDSTAAVFSIPLEVLDLILERLDQRSALSLSFTCKAAAGAQLFEKHIYRDLTSGDDIPRGTFNEFKRNYRPRHRRILGGLNGRTGPMVKTMAVHQYMSADSLSEITRMCPNLKKIDFTAVEECIDWGDWRGHKGKNGTKALDFRWFIAFGSLPALFDQLTSVSVKVSRVCDWFAGKNEIVAAIGQGRNFIPQLFEACPLLQHLTLHVQPRIPSEQYHRRLNMQHHVLGQSLKTLTIVDAVFIFQSGIPRGWLRCFPSLETLRIGLYSDFRTLWYRCGSRSKIVRYIESLELLRQNTSYRLELSDASSAADFPLDLGMFFHLSQINVETLARLSFAPVWDLTPTTLINYGYFNQFSPPLSDWRSRLRPAYKSTLTALKAQGIPINVTLRSGSSTSFFPDAVGLLAHDSRNNVDPVLEKCSLLDEFGHFVTSLSLVYDPAFAYSDAAPGYCGKKRDQSGRFQRVQHLPPQGPEALLERLGKESEDLGRFFGGLRRMCPILQRFEVYMPKALFPSRDTEFVAEVLPTGTWSIAHPLIKPLPDLPFPKRGFRADQPSTTPCPTPSYQRRPRTEIQKHQAKCRKVEEERCPFVGRAFTRMTEPEGSDINGKTVNAEKGFNESETSKFWRSHVMERPEFDAPEPTMMDRVRKQREWKVQVEQWLGSVKGEG